MSRLIDQPAFTISWNRKSCILIYQMWYTCIAIRNRSVSHHCYINKGEKANCTYIFNYSLEMYWSIGQIVKMFLYTCNYVNLRLKIYYLRKSFRRGINCNMNLD